MVMAQTSLFAFDSISQEDLKGKQQTVFEYIKAHPGCTNEDISKGTGLRIQSVTPRTGELRELGRIEVSGRSMCSSGRYAMTYEVIGL